MNLICNMPIYDYNSIVRLTIIHTTIISGEVVSVRAEKRGDGEKRRKKSCNIYYIIIKRLLLLLYTTVKKTEATGAEIKRARANLVQKKCPLCWRKDVFLR